MSIDERGERVKRWRQSWLDKSNLSLLVPEQVSFAAAMPRDPAPGLTLACGVIPSGSILIEIRRCSGPSHRPGVRSWYAFNGAGSVGGRVESHCSRSGVRPQCDLKPKAQPKMRDFDLKGT